MKTIFLHSGRWLLVLVAFSFLAAVVNLNLINRVDELLNRQEFELFLNEKISEFVEKQQETEQITKNESLADSPEQAALNDYLMTVDPVTKTVPRERLKTAYLYQQKLLAANPYKSTNSLQWQGTVSNFGGRTRAIMWDPNDPFDRKVWAGGVTGGLWYKENITNSAEWIPVNDFWTGLSISCMTYDPNNTSTFYVGTGEAQTALIIYRESSGVGFGIQRSQDGGSTWDVLPGTEEFEYVTDIEVRDEDGTSVIYAAVVSGIYKGTIHQSEPSDGLFRSVVGSDSWEQVLPLIDGQETPYSPSDIEIGADGRIFIGTMPNVEGFGGATILYSDSGIEDSWEINDEYRTLIEDTPDFNLPGRVILAAAPSDEDRVYAFIAQGYYYGLPAYECHIATRSYDKGESWEMVPIPPDNAVTGNWAFIAWHALTAAVDPNDPDRLYAGALMVYASDDAGDNWSLSSTWTNTTATNYIHADQHRILFQEGSSNKMLVASDGGVFYTPNASLDAVQFNEKNEGFNTLQMYKVALHPETDITLFLGGMQDNGTIYYDGNPIENANRISGGDGGACFIDKNESGILITSSQNNRFNMISNGQFVGSANNWASGNFISSVAYDYRMNTLYANAVTVTNQLPDQVLRISGIPSPPYTGDFLDMETGSTVPFTYVGYSDHSGDESATLFLGTQAGRMFLVENAESDPEVTEIGTDEFPNAAISCITIGQSEDTIMVTFSNYGVSSVWQTYNGGADWSDVEGNLPDMPIRWALYHPYSAKTAMLATELGIWTCGNTQDEVPDWQPDNEGLANVRVDMLQIRESDLTVLAGTHGRGFFSTTYNYNPTTSVKNRLAERVSVHPNPAGNHTNIEINDKPGQEITYRIIHSSGSVVLKGKIASGENKIQLDISNLTPGTYFIVLESENKTTTQKLIKV